MLSRTYLILASLEAFLVLASPAQETFTLNNKPYDVQVCSFSLADQEPSLPGTSNRPIEAGGVTRPKAFCRVLHGMLAFVIFT